MADLLIGSADQGEQARKLLNDCTPARGRIWAEYSAKLSYFQQLPLKIFQLAHPDPGMACVGAQQCLRLRDLGGLGALHRQRQRFVDLAWAGTAEDPALRPYVQRIAAGEDIGSADFHHLRLWLAKVCERSVEGVRSLITTTMKCAPRASVSYLSTELRFASF